MADDNTQQGSLTNDFSAVAGVVLHIQVGVATIDIPAGMPIHISFSMTDGAPAVQVIQPALAAPAAEEFIPEKEFIAVGDLHPVDGSICIAVDDRHNNADFVPRIVFVDKSTFDLKELEAIADKVNQEPDDLDEDQKIGHGRHDWTKITNAQGAIIASVMPQLAPNVPAEFRSRLTQDFWLSSSYGHGKWAQGHVRRAGASLSFMENHNLNWVAVVRSDKARLSDLTA